ncbi:MAG: GNAT family acetyltransferase [Methylobacteriaceae bacterium]|nr:GNAT family acetyltransferase [Methylobacteriaceae bacterium]
MTATTIPVLAISDLRPDEISAAIAIWEEAGLLRPWNDPRADAALALRSADSTILVGRDDDRIIATCMVGHDGHRGWVYYLAVTPAFRRRGVATRMMRAAEQWCNARGIPKLQLMVRSENAEVARFYAALGYATSDVAVLAKWLNPKSD